MAEINWESVWKNALDDTELFPAKSVKNNTVSISCPTRFSKSGELAIEITPSFKDNGIDLEILLFNDNVSLDDLKSKDKNLVIDKDDFNKLATSLVDYELSNRLLDRFSIKSDGFDNEDEAKDSLIDYINNKATESGRMFDDKLDELNDAIDVNKDNVNKHESLLKSIRENRMSILKKVGDFLHTNYNWTTPKNEELSDSTATFLDENNNLMAVVSLVDNYIVVDLAKGVTAKVSVMQSDEDIASELSNDIEAAKSVIADREIDQLKDVLATSREAEDMISNESYFESLERRVSALESLYINRKLRRMK